MTYYVFKAMGRSASFKWELSSEHEDLAAAELAATDLCPKGEFYTEPGKGLDRCFFGSAASDRWSARIDTKKP